MRSLKNIVINAAMILAFLFGLTLSATAAEPSFEEVKALAENGDSYYQNIFGHYYTDGKSVRQDYTKAFYWYQKSADQGNRHGQLYVGYAYKNGEGVRQDYTKALEFFRKSANQGLPHAQSSIGLMYEYGRGVRQNKTTAKEWFGKACDNGYQGGCDEYKKLNEQGY
uniref:tetratricopeptide repeat protein n=1 Tax=Psychrobacter sp. TaxID=56811 RepID=UPI0015977C98|nr:tetratricopeptide repeat protein [Psychrobacter sp.]QJS05482.1 sel1 repeat protein [Psychrobacter sp.]